MVLFRSAFCYVLFRADARYARAVLRRNLFACLIARRANDVVRRRYVAEEGDSVVRVRRRGRARVESLVCSGADDAISRVR